MESNGWTMRYLVWAVFLVVPLIGVRPGWAAAQEQSARDSVLNEFAAEVADLQRQMEVAGEYMRLGTTGVELRYGAAKAGAAPDSVRVVERGAAVRTDPSEDADTVRTVNEGIGLRFLSMERGWIEVVTDSPTDGKQVGWIPAEAVQPVFAGGQAMYMAGVASVGIWESVIEKAHGLREKYANNPYVRVTGFDVEVGLPPSLSVGFEFK